MAVFKALEEKEIINILDNFNIGSLTEYNPILKGIDNSNFKLTTTDGEYILTIFNSRLKKDDLPYYLNFMQHLSDKGIPCPKIIKNKQGEIISTLEGIYNFSIVSFMPGAMVKDLEIAHIRKAANTLAKMHIAGEDFSEKKENVVGIEGSPDLLISSITLADKFEKDLKELIREEIRFLKDGIKEYAELPKGNIHADYFSDNIFFNDRNDITAVIDFYFACYDFYVYDLMIAINAWCFEKHMGPNSDRIAAFLDEYQKIRPLSEKEKSSLNFFGRVAAMRIVTTRIHDWFYTPKTAYVDTHNPLEYIRILKSYISQETNIKL